MRTTSATGLFRRDRRLQSFRMAGDRSCRASQGRGPHRPDNDLILDRLLGPKKKTPDNIICGWGAHGAYRGRNQQMINLFEKHRITPMALKITKNGHPQHPLYLPYDAKPQPFIGIAA